MPTRSLRPARDKAPLEGEQAGRGVAATEPASPQIAELWAARSRSNSLQEISHQLTPGARIGEHYVVRQLLGEGGMGLVVLAHDELLMRDVALKFVQPFLRAQSQTTQALMTEARAMARVKHPNVVEIYAYGTHQGVPYFAMEYVAGRTAEDWFVARSAELNGLIPVDEVLGILDQCCRGVAAIHATGSVHGDLKPTNLLLAEKSYRVAVADFGIAMLLDAGELRQSGGTPDYMPPEAFDTLDDPSLIQRRDVFSVAVMAYEFLVGRRPFPELKMAAFLLGQRPAPTPPSQLRPDLPQEFDRVILAALNPDLHERTPTIGQFWRELEAARRRMAERRAAARIVIVDDDPIFAAYAQQALQLAFPFASITHCVDGKQALQRLADEPADLVLVDLQLPDMNGVELTAEIRARHPNKLRILIVTAHGSAADWKLLSSLGADGFMVKPVEAKSLSSAVGNLLEQRRASRPQ
jgi:eukaryotic-like serine/threonine-protein kinase